MNFKSNYIFLFCVFLLSLCVKAQELTTAETLAYIERVVNNDIQEQDNFYGGNKYIKINIDGDAIQVKYTWDNQDVLFLEKALDGITYNLLTFDVDKIQDIEKRTYQGFNTIALYCDGDTKECFELEEEGIMPHFSDKFCDNPSSINHFDYVNAFYCEKEENQDRVYNALVYLFQKSNNDNEESVAEDPFASTGIDNSTKAKQEIISLEKKHGVSYLDIMVNGVKDRAILDSGASDVSISKSLEQQLLAEGVISKKDYLSPGLYSIADGSVVKCNRFVAKFIDLGNVRIKNVRCSVNDSDDTILLGKACLDRFKSWQIDNELNQLILKY